MERPASGSSEWTATVEAAVQAELLRRSRLLKWAVALSLLVGALAVALAVALRGTTWEELAPRVRQQMAPMVNTQVVQSEATIALHAELLRLESELRRIEAELRAQAAAPDPALLALQRRVRALEAQMRAGPAWPAATPADAAAAARP